MMRRLFLVPVMALMASCSSLPVPGERIAGCPNDEAEAVLRRAAAIQGDPWKRYSKVEVSYSGTWSTLATKLQPVLTDPGFREGSVEIYQPRVARVRQTHKGPSGTKEVVRQPSRIEVSLNGVKSADVEVKDASALVADAYTIFLFGPSWLVDHARDFCLLDDDDLSGEACRLVAGRLEPGIGNSREDEFIAWIGKESGLMKRFQFSLNGLDSTRGADVDVVFSGHWTAKDGSIWPSRFIERIQRPIPIQAHDWRMTSLTVDGRRMK
jgi:hypothetical protein